MPIEEGPLLGEHTEILKPGRGA